MTDKLPQEELDEDFLETVEELGRLNGEWITFVALRDGLSVALQDTNKVTRNETLRLAERLLPNIFNRDSSQLHKYWESNEERRLHERATMHNRPFIEVVHEEIENQETELKNLDPNYSAKSTRAYLDRLKKILQENQSDEFFEGKIIYNDATTGTHLSSSQQGKYYEFALSAGRGLRIRVTHDSHIESINGADLVYEHHIPNVRRVRIVSVQYKILNDENHIPKSKKLKSQLDKLDNWYCNKLPCISSDKPCSNFYRLPSCSAFLRATNRLRPNKSTGVSVGYYIPVCRVLQKYNNRGVAINAKNHEGETISHKMFEELFNANILGSRWLTYEELENYYKEQKIIEQSGVVSMHFQLYHQDAR